MIVRFNEEFQILIGEMYGYFMTNPSVLPDFLDYD